MAKGPGKPKGRPRKIVDLEQSQSESTPAANATAECSYAAELKESNVTQGTAGSIKQTIELEIKSAVLKQDDARRQEGEKEADMIQIEDGEIPPLRKRGMTLGYVAPILKRGIPVAQLQISEMEKENAKWANAIILYVIGDTPTITYLKTFLHKQCGISAIEVFYHNEGYFVIRFEDRKDKDKMLFEGPYMIANRPIIVKDWVAGFCFEKEVLREIPLWVRLPKLPLNCWSGDSLSRIGSVLGKPICADECTSKQQRISYARLLVEVDVTKPLLYKVQIEGENGMMVEQKVYYEWVPLFCQKCHKVGHICKDQKKDTAMPNQKQQWLPKDKGKEVVVEAEEKQEIWEKPKQKASSSIQVGHIDVPTGNFFEELVTGIVEEGGDLFPLVTT